MCQAQAYHGAPSGLNISDQSGSGAFKLYLIQARKAGSQDTGGGVVGGTMTGALWVVLTKGALRRGTY